MRRKEDFWVAKHLLYYCVFFLLLGTIIGLCSSCSDSSSNCNNCTDKRELYQNKREAYYKKKHYNKFHSDEVTYKKVICPKCNGVGEVEFSTAGKVVFGIVTLGFGCLTTPTDRCETCYGTGYIEVPDI